MVLKLPLILSLLHIPHTKSHIRSKLVGCKNVTEFLYLWTLCMFCLKSYNRRTQKRHKSHQKSLLWSFYRTQKPSKHPILPDNTNKDYNQSKNNLNIHVHGTKNLSPELLKQFLVRYQWYEPFQV